ncbi:MAG: PDZ domain-containing protein [Phycisphaerales bacterium]|nr:PDZ domain-containing protein [Phycisphaerales bacterium]
MFFLVLLSCNVYSQVVVSKNRVPSDIYTVFSQVGDSDLSIMVKNRILYINGKEFDNSWVGLKLFLMRDLFNGKINYGLSLVKDSGEDDILLNHYAQVYDSKGGLPPLKLFLGVSTEMHNKNGLKVLQVYKNTVADFAGIAVGDIILKADSQILNTPDKLYSIVNKHKVGDVISLDILRDFVPMSMNVTLSQYAEGHSADDTPLNNLKHPPFNISQTNKYVLDMLLSHGNNNLLKKQLNLLLWTHEKAFPDIMVLGVLLKELPHTTGLEVIGINKGGLLYKKGIRKGDFIVDVNHMHTNTLDVIDELLRSLYAQNIRTLTVTYAKKNNLSNLKTITVEISSKISLMSF